MRKNQRKANKKKLHAKLILSTNRIKRKTRSNRWLISCLRHCLNRKHAGIYLPKKNQQPRTGFNNIIIKNPLNEGENVERKWLRRQWTGIKPNEHLQYL